MSDCTDWDNQKTKSKVDIDTTLRDVKFGMVGSGISTAMIISLNEVPAVGVPISFLVIYIIVHVIQWHRSQKGGDDQ
jgi:hypothetical protein